MKNDTQKLILYCSKKLYMKKKVKSLFQKDFCEYANISRQTLFKCCTENRLTPKLKEIVDEILRQG